MLSKIDPFIISLVLIAVMCSGAEYLNMPSVNTDTLTPTVKKPENYKSLNDSTFVFSRNNGGFDTIVFNQIKTRVEKDTVINYIKMSGRNITIKLDKDGSFMCPWDTMKGILMWNDAKDPVNHGEKVDTGYWVGRCSPQSFRIMDMVFVPGESWHTGEQYTVVQKKNGKEIWTNPRVFNHRYPTGGKFYTYKWKHVPSNHVYGLYKLHRQPVDTMEKKVIEMFYMDSLKPSI